MKKYISNNVEITAIDFKRDMADGRRCMEKQEAWCHDTCGCCPSYKYYIEDKKGIHYLNPGDKIVLGDNGEKYVLHQDLFNLIFKDCKEEVLVEETRDFKLKEKIYLKNSNEFFDYWKFLEKELGCQIDEFEINGGDKEPIIAQDTVYIDSLYIKASNNSMHNLSKIFKLIEHLEKYAHAEIDEDGIKIDTSNV